MARWVLTCPACRREFTHSEVPVRSFSSLSSLDGGPEKPTFPEGGLRLRCPGCSATSLYQRYELTLKKP